MLFLNFIKAFLLNQWAKLFGYEPLAPNNVINGRYRICDNCDFANGGNCEKCGCLLMAKTMLSTEKCPIGKWGRVWVKKNRTT